eukprot:TRINITY_DN11966_c0_g1_i4.p1 TRINITY_DN11966_c0_g1~~TRINITY_DN11966_c0_g1_i4.p1  ORF type:complete len:266 (-),score=39.18 TRINITY_DN11966_c0_g1_i4:161-958(-)
MVTDSPRLTYRNDFIDATIIEPQDEVTRRACSLPARLKPVYKDEFKESAVIYTAELLNRADSLFSEVRSPLQHHERQGSDGRYFGQEDGTFSELALVMAGSQGHPDLCGGICKFWLRRGQCEKGSDCAYCHLDHSNAGPSSNLQKRQRELFQRLPSAAILMVAVPFFHERMGNIVTKAEKATAAGQQLSMLQQELHELLSASFDKATKAYPAVAKREERMKLENIFSRVRFRYMFDLISRSLYAEDRDAAEALQELRKRIQRSWP